MFVNWCGDETLVVSDKLGREYGSQRYTWKCYGGVTGGTVEMLHWVGRLGQDLPRAVYKHTSNCNTHVFNFCKLCYTYVYLSGWKSHTGMDITFGDIYIYIDR